MAKLREGHQVCQIVTNGNAYEIDFTKSSQINVCTKTERPIRCFFDLPSHWQMPNADALKFLRDNLQRSTPQRSPSLMLPVTDQDVKAKLEEVLNGSRWRHDGSRCNCLHGSSNYVATEAFQVNNLDLWRKYQGFVRSMQRKHRNHRKHKQHIEEIHPSVSDALTDFAKQINVDLPGNERLLLHGTRDFELAKAIATEGFDNRIARDGNTLYGKGTYFAAQTCKRDQYATPAGRRKASPLMVGTMLIARVAIGDPFYAEGQCKTLTRALPESNHVLK